MNMNRLKNSLSLIFLVWITNNVLAQEQRAEPVPQTEQKDEFTFIMGEKRLLLQAGLKLSAVIKALGDPEDIDHINTPNRLYGWGTEQTAGVSVIVDADPETDSVTDWAIVRYQDGKAKSVVFSTHPGHSPWEPIVSRPTLAFVK